jgi:FtsP/CotA-like multicopper oxidase with cupredoxin domain
MFCNGTLRCAPIRVTEGQTIRVRFVNGMSEETVIHWHGLGVPLGMDGVPDIARPGVALGQELVPVPGHDTGHLLLPPAPRGTA